MGQAKKILVTGAGGFIGSHLCEQLTAEGYSVRALVHYRSDSGAGWLDQSKIRSDIEILRGDVRDASFVRSASKDVECVFHLAALIGIPYSYLAPESYVDVNLKGSMNVFQAAREFGFRVVHTSTSEVYGTAQSVPITETHPLQGQSPYSASKIAADQMAFAFHRSFGTAITVVRPFNSFGPRQSERAVIPTIISQLKSTGKLKLGSVTPTRDFCFVEDTVQGFISAFKSDRGFGDVFNIARGEEISIRDTANLIAELMGLGSVNVDTEELRLRPLGSEVERLWGANSKAKEILGWKPRFADSQGFRRALMMTIEHYLSRSEFGKDSGRYVV